MEKSWNFFWDFCGNPEWYHIRLCWNKTRQHDQTNHKSGATSSAVFMVFYHSVNHISIFITRPLTHCYTIYGHRSESALAQVMAWCLMAPSHYQNQCWLIISEVLWHSPEGSFIRNAQDISPWFNLKITDLRIQLDIFLPGANKLTHRGRVTHICIRKLAIIGSDNGLSPVWCQAIIWTNLWNIVNWTTGNKLQWSLVLNLYIFIKENAFENVVWKIAAILSQPQCVNKQC